jgi:hypothetical protein
MHNLDSGLRSGRTATTRQEPSATDPNTEITPEFQRGWEAGLVAARHWHESRRDGVGFQRNSSVRQRSIKGVPR